MKIRSGFVSNSSSASFCLNFKSTLTRSQIAKYICASDEWIAKRWNQTERESFSFKPNEPKKMEKCEPGRKMLKGSKANGYKMLCDTSMFNDWRDVNGWLFIWALQDNRIKDIELIEIKQIEEEYHECDHVTKFSELPWEAQDLHRRDTPKEKKQEIRQMIEYGKYQFINYLNNIDQELTKKEQLFLTKNKLNNL
jgi:hypothetical protein